MKVLSVLAGIIALASCATAPAVYDFDRTATVPGASADDVWNTVVEIFAENDWSIATKERASGVITTDWVPADGAYMDCGHPGGFLEDEGKSGLFKVTVDGAGAGTSLTVDTSWKGTRRIMDAGVNVVLCVSTGLFETWLHREVGRRLGG